MESIKLDNSNIWMQKVLGAYVKRNIYTSIPQVNKYLKQIDILAYVVASRDSTDEISY